MSLILLGAALVAGGYLLGAIPFGLIVGLAAAGVDVRTAGSGNIGATNVARVAGKRYGVLVLALDAAKGLIPTVVSRALAPELPWLHVAAGGAAIVGHIAPVYVGFKGGKGVATALGVFVALVPWAALSGAVTFATLFALWRIASVGSLVGAAVAVVVVLLAQGLSPYAWCGLAAFAAIAFRHRGNIARLVRRRESPV